MTAPCPVLVFAKAPRAGLAKTRLAPALGMQGAAQLAARMLAHAVAEACAAGLGPVVLCCAPDASDPAFARLARVHGVGLAPQGEGDLGARMARALRRELDGCRRVLLVGTDAPAVDAVYLRQAAAALLDHDAVFGPAADGGYTLVGLSCRADGLFHGMGWSTPRVMAQTRARLRALSLSHAELATLHDIDEPADLAFLPAGWLEAADAATAAR